jgi:23S rRNA (adenine-N6)-dimethyltransferase
VPAGNPLAAAAAAVLAAGNRHGDHGGPAWAWWSSVSGRASTSGAAGQHFLAGRGLAAELVERAGVGPADLVVELGAGTGLLTEALAARAGKVLAVERDPRLAARAARRLAGHGNVRLVTGDARTLPLPGRPFRVVANLPFGATTALLRRLLADPLTPLERADLVVQWELARRWAAGRPSTPDTVRAGTWWRLQVAGRLAPACFRPPPSVSAGLLVAVRRRPPLLPVAGRHRLEALLRAAFRQPAVPLRRSLVPPLTRGQLRRLAADLGFAPGARPADLNPRQWAGVAAFLPGPWEPGRSRP